VANVGTDFDRNKLGLFLGSSTAALTSGFTFHQWILQLPLGLFMISAFEITFLMKVNTLHVLLQNICHMNFSVSVLNTRVNL